MKVAIIGSGIIGSAIAFHLASLGMRVEVWETQTQPGLGSTGAALGFLLGVASAKTSGRIVRLRLDSLKLYDTWLPELEKLTGRRVLLHQGIVCLPRDGHLWRELAQVRAKQGYSLEPVVIGQYQGFYSPTDRVVHPLELVSALVEAATQRGAKFHWGCAWEQGREADSDRVVVCGGLGSQALVELPLQAVGGQAIEVAVAADPHLPALHIVDELGDVNLVPLGGGRYWIGATVEFDPTVLPRAENVTYLLGRVGQYFPQFQESTVLNTWANYRPRPIGRGAPVIEWCRPGWLVASGHYRNGLLLAPITAQIVGEMLINSTTATSINKS
ncbi:MAG: NAD(P)/FAD-dependent oxidoreductase [Pseudanabaenaceae cyanobacterium]